MPPAPASAPASAARIPSASASASAALHQSPAPPSTHFSAHFPTRAMTSLAGHGALGPLAATCIRSAALLAGAVSTALHSDDASSSSSRVALPPIPGSQHLHPGERGLLAGLRLQLPLDVDLSPLLGSTSHCISNNTVQEQLVAGAPLATVQFWLLAEEMLPVAVPSPLGLQSASSIQPGLLAVVAGGGCGMTPSGQHLLLGMPMPHRRLKSSCPFAARVGGVPRRGYAAAATGEAIQESINRDEKIEDMSRRLRLVEKTQEVMLRRQRNGRLALVAVIGFGGTLCHIYGDSLVKKGDETVSKFLGDRVKTSHMAEFTWSNFSAAVNHATNGLLGYSKEQQAINEKEIEDRKKAREQLAREWEQKKSDWNRHKKEKEERFNQSRPANEHPIVRCIAWLQFCMHDEELEVQRAEMIKFEKLAVLRALAIRNQEEKEDEKKKKTEEEEKKKKKRDEEEKKKREEEETEKRKNQSLAEIRARAIRNWEEKEEKK